MTGSVSRLEASPLNAQRVAVAGPFFQGWLVRAIDHVQGRSIVIIVASFSSRGAASFDQHYVFCAVAEGGETRTFTAFPDAASVRVASPPGAAGLDVTWTAEGLGALRFHGDECLADFAFANGGSVSMRVTNRKPWVEEGSSSRGPEGWLGRTKLLPSRYFIHSVGSDVTYALRIGDRAVTGAGFAHMECNYGDFFPRGWVWAEAIAPGNAGSFSLVIGKIVVGPLEPLIATFYLRRPGDRVAVFRTTDLDRVRYVLDGTAREVRLDFASRWSRRRATLRIEARGGSFHKVFVPTPDGMSDAPGCEETYTAVATATLDDGLGPEETCTFPMTAFEFGGSFLGAVHRNHALA